MGSEIDEKFKILKSASYYRDNKKKFNKGKNNFISKKYMSRKAIGCCSYLYDLFKPESYEDFWQQYVKNFDENFDRERISGKQEKGRSIEDLLYLAERYYEEVSTKTDTKATLEECFDDLVNHAIIETYDGHIPEKIVLKRINECKGYTAETTYGDIDAICGVDIVVHKDGKIAKCIQVKPFTTFKGNNNVSLKSDRRNFYEKQKHLDEILGKHIEIEYMVYNSEHKFLEINGKHRFPLSMFCDTNGITKIDDIEKLHYSDI